MVTDKECKAFILGSRTIFDTLNFVQFTLDDFGITKYYNLPLVQNISKNVLGVKNFLYNIVSNFLMYFQLFFFQLDASKRDPPPRVRDRQAWLAQVAVRPRRDAKVSAPDKGTMTCYFSNHLKSDQTF